MKNKQQPKKLSVSSAVRRVLLKSPSDDIKPAVLVDKVNKLYGDPDPASRPNPETICRYGRRFRGYGAKRK